MAREELLLAVLARRAAVGQVEEAPVRDAADDAAAR